MTERLDKHQQEVSAAYKQRWEVRLPRYDRLLRSVMEMIEVTARTMKADGMSEAAEDLGKALLAIEDAWAKVAVLALEEEDLEIVGTEDLCDRLSKPFKLV